jgi:hypothetical protein
MIINRIITWYHTIETINLYITIFKTRKSFKIDKILEIKKSEKIITKIKLIIIEFLILSIFLLANIYLVILGTSIFFLFLFITLRVAEARLGISLLTILVRIHGIDFILIRFLFIYLFIYFILLVYNFILIRK